MKALASLPAALLLALAGGFLANSPAAAQASDDPEKIMNDCSDSDLPSEVVDYCLHRVHKLNETNPTSDSEALEAQLQRRADQLDRSGNSYDRSNDNQGYDNNDRSDDRNRPDAYYAVDNKLSAKVQEFARSHGVSPDTLLNLWLQEKLQEQNS